jgi:hypothetical protein
MFSDYFNVTVPESHSHIVEKALLPLFSELEIVQVSPGYYSPTQGGGSVKINVFLRVFQYSFSGAVLRLAREAGLLDSLLFCFADVPHKVTRLDIAHDVAVNSPVVLGRLYSSAVQGLFRFSRKSVDPSHVKRILSPSLYGGRDTGTVYIGLRKHNVSLMVYDKRQELLSRLGSDIGYNLTRYELRCSRKLGISLRDVSSPDSLFWAHMGTILKTPTNVPEWVSSPEGYSMPSRVALLPYEALKRSIASSPVLADWVSLAGQIGDSGSDSLLRLIKREVDRLVIARSEAGTLAQPSGAATKGVGT